MPKQCIEPMQRQRECCQNLWSELTTCRAIMSRDKAGKPHVYFDPETVDADMVLRGIEIADRAISRAIIFAAGYSIINRVAHKNADNSKRTAGKR